MLVLLLLLLSSPAPAAGDDGGAVPVLNPISSFCNSTAVKRTYLPNSTFEANLNSLFAVLSKNASVSGYASGAFGAAPDTAYGLVLCRGDFTGNDCSAARLASSFHNAAGNCMYSKDVTVYHDQYQLRYSDQDVLTSTVNSPETAAWNMNNVSDANDVAAFDALVAKLVNAVADKASNASRRYAAGRAGFEPEMMNIYTMAQCTPDLSTALCRSCLAGIIGQMPKWFSGRIGGRILGVRCDIRYEKDLFFKTNSDMVVLTPLPDRSQGDLTRR